MPTTAGIAGTEAARRRRPRPSPTRGHGEYLQRPEHAPLGRDEFDAGVREQAARGYGRFDELSQQLHKMVVGLAGEAPEDSQSFLDVPLMASVRRAREQGIQVDDPLTARSALQGLARLVVPERGWEHVVDRTPLGFLKYLPAGAFGVGKLPSRQKQWYHGTDTAFDEFQGPQKLASGPRTTFASEDADMAGRFTGETEYTPESGVYGGAPNIRPVQITADHVWDFRKPEHRKIILDEHQLLGYEDRIGLEEELIEGYWGTVEDRGIQTLIRENGFQGFLVKESRDELSPLNIGIYDAKKHMRPVWEGATDAAQREIDFPSEWKHAPSDWYLERAAEMKDEAERARRHGLGPPTKSHTLADLEAQVGKQAEKVLKKKPRGIVPKMSLEEMAKRQEEMESVFSFINPKKNP